MPLQRVLEGRKRPECLDLAARLRAFLRDDATNGGKIQGEFHRRSENQSLSPSFVGSRLSQRSMLPVMFSSRRHHQPRRCQVA